MRILLIVLAVVVFAVSVVAAALVGLWAWSPVFDGVAPDASLKSVLAAGAVLAVGYFVALFLYWLARRGAPR